MCITGELLTGYYLASKSGLPEDFHRFKYKKKNNMKYFLNAKKTKRNARKKKFARIYMRFLHFCTSQTTATLKVVKTECYIVKSNTVYYNIMSLLSFLLSSLNIQNEKRKTN